MKAGETFRKEETNWNTLKASVDSNIENYDLSEIEKSENFLKASEKTAIRKQIEINLAVNNTESLITLQT
jgi:PP-loop superfamily ATP-utilizing enzyme